MQLALLVISACGFNMRLRWDESPTRDTLSNPIDATIVTVSTTLLEKMVFPAWVFDLPFDGYGILTLVYSFGSLTVS